MAKIALQLYTLRDKMQDADGVARTLEAVAKIGYKNVEPAGWAITGAEKLRELCDANGLSICSTHGSFQAMQDDIQQVIAEHQIMGCKYPGIGGMPGEYRTSGEGFAEFAKLATQVGLKLSEAGMAFHYHNHSFELTKFDGKTGLDILIENSCGDCVKNELDLYWVQHGGGSPVAWINKLGKRAPLVHFKDMQISVEMKQSFAEVGEGNLDWPGIIGACVANDVQYYIVEQDTCERDSLESVKISYDNMRGMGLE
ncbi:MAG: sugar phosphate isomerase/epimerase [Armatimonadia bacterium]